MRIIIMHFIRRYMISGILKWLCFRIICRMCSCLCLGFCFVRKCYLWVRGKNIGIFLSVCLGRLLDCIRCILRCFWYFGLLRLRCIVGLFGMYINNRLKYVTLLGGELYSWLIIGGRKAAILCFGLCRFKSNPS